VNLLVSLSPGETVVLASLDVATGPYTELNVKDDQSDQVTEERQAVPAADDEHGPY
jgi:hypothetical protein